MRFVVISGFLGPGGSLGPGALWTENGVSWTQASGISSVRGRFLFTGAIWVAVGGVDGGTQVHRSTDGKSWSEITSLDALALQWYDVAFAASRLIIGSGPLPGVGDVGAVVAISGDGGVTWAPAVLPTSVSPWTRTGGVAYVGDGTWIVGGDPQGTTPAMIRSEDNGVSWSVVTNSLGIYYVWSVEYCSAINTAVAHVYLADGQSRIVYSIDRGLTWNLADITPADGANFMRFAANQNGFKCSAHMGGDPGVVMSSADGVSWTADSTGYEAGPDWMDVRWDGSRWLLGGTAEKLPGFTDPTAVLVSGDGAAWTPLAWPALLSDRAYGVGAAFITAQARVRGTRLHRVGGGVQ